MERCSLIVEVMGRVHTLSFSRELLAPIPIYYKGSEIFT